MLASSNIFLNSLNTTHKIFFYKQKPFKECNASPRSNAYCSGINKGSNIIEAAVMDLVISLC